MHRIIKAYTGSKQALLLPGRLSQVSRISLFFIKGGINVNTLLNYVMLYSYKMDGLAIYNITVVYRHSSF